MGFNFSALVASDQFFDLRSMTRQIYGADVRLADDRSPIHKAMHPGEPYAATVSGHHWLFDWERCERWMMGPPLARGTQVAYTLHSDLDFYGFTVFQEGKIFRQRIGTRREGIVCDVGTPLEIEYEIITELVGKEKLDAGLYAWYAEHNSDCELKHWHIGTDIVFAILALQTGVTLHHVRESSDFFMQDAFRISLPETDCLTRFPQN